MKSGFNATAIERRSVVNQVAHLLKEKIISGEWKPGDKLPSETDIAKMYKVNRLSVRMALQRLATLGVIETRTGEGSFVRDFSIYPVLDEISDYYDSMNRMDEIQQMRRLIEDASVVEAVKKASESEMEVLEQCLELYIEALEKLRYRNTDVSLRRLVEADFGFHAQIVHMSHNRLFEEVYYMVRNLTRSHIEKMLLKRNVVLEQEESEQYHSELCRCIRNRDLQGAQCMLEIIICDNFHDHLLEGVQ